MSATSKFPETTLTQVRGHEKVASSGDRRSGDSGDGAKIEFPTTDADEANPTTTAPAIDAGNGPNDHYKSRLSPFRYSLRSKCLPIIRYETDILSTLQAKMRHPMMDVYFAWTANLASHTFYVLMLPLPIWFGAGKLSRDLIHVLGLGIFFSGHFKDYLCLPRPRSPPLHRITMSSYTTQEYGFPSSHSANATAVTLIFWKHIEQSPDIGPNMKLVCYAISVLYYVSLIFGRVYCGMHGFFDVITGSLIGVVLFLFRFHFGDFFDNIELTQLGIMAPPIIIVGYLLLIHFHSEPVDDCPCFDDSVAFIGVLIGIDISHWQFLRSSYLDHTYTIPYDYAKVGLIGTILRVVLGIALVATWKAVSKPIIFTILPPVYKGVGVYLPRRNFEATAFSKKTTRQIRSQSISNMNLQENVGDFIKSHEKRDEMGPENDIDMYEILDYEKSASPKRRSKSPEDATTKDSTADSRNTTTTTTSGANTIKKPFQSGVFRPRYDVEIVGRLIVYAGVATFASWGFALASEFVNLN